ncbi:EamA family transporter [Christensenellaceae bacterium OttesenSCG-928-K19]|nr:EamA family transporter [Christensenellaceae bacterium OttesenSCG-928-K19]
MWIVLAFASAFFAGITSILAKIGIKNTDSNLATAIRTLVVLAFAWIIVFATDAYEALGSIDSYSLVFLILSGLATGGSWLCYFKALQIGEVNKVTAIDRFSVVLTMLLALIFLGESITGLGALAIVLITVGTYLMVSKSVAKKNHDSKSADSKKWIIFAMLAAVFASLQAILGKVGISNINSNLGTAIRTVVVVIMAWCIVFLRGKQRDVKTIDKRSWLFLVLSGVATGASWLCFYGALHDGPASVVIPIDKLSILVTVVFSIIILKERFSKKSVLGLALLVVGTLLLLISQ